MPSLVGGDKFRRLFLMFFKAQAACDTSRHDSDSDSNSNSNTKSESGKLLKLFPAAAAQRISINSHTESKS